MGREKGKGKTPKKKMRKHQKKLGERKTVKKKDSASNKALSY